MALVALFASDANGQTAPEIPTQRYTVQAGDSCASIAQHFFGNRRRHDIIHSYNPGMGPPPHELVPGTVLTLPVRLPNPGEVPDARLTSVRRDVLSRRADAADWQRAHRGEALFRGWRVNTLEASSAQVTFQDTSRIEIRSNTLIIIYGGSSTTARASTGNATLDRGTLRTQLGSLRMRVDTPTSSADLNGGSSVISTDDDGSRVSSHAGAGARVTGAGRRGAGVRVRPGYGSVVRTGQAPSAPRPLPLAPTLVEGSASTFVAVGNSGATLEGAWTPVANAAKYHVEVLRDDAPPAVVASVDVDASVLRYEVRGLPPGAYHVTLATIDADGLESAPTPPSVAHVIGVPIHVPGELETRTPPTDPDSTVPREAAVIVPPGAYLEIPEGLSCEGQDAQRRVVFERVGGDPVRCMASNGDIVQTIPVSVVASEAQLTAGDSERATMERHVDVTIPLRLVDATTEIPSTATWQTSEGVEVIAFDRTARTITLRADDTAAVDASLRLMLPSESGGVVEIARLPIGIAPVPEPPPVLAPPPPPAARARPTADVASNLGDPLAMGVVAHPIRDVDVAASFGAGHFRGQGTAGTGRGHFALSLHERIGVELHFGGATPSSASPRFYGATGYGLGLRSLLFRRDTLDVHASADVWVPIRPLNSLVIGPLFRPSMSVEFLPVGRYSLRTRAGSILDFNADAIRVFTLSVMGDVAFAERFSVGLEANTRLGRSNGTAFTTVGVGLYGAANAGAWTFTVYGQLEPTTDAQRLSPTWVAGFAARVQVDTPGH